MAILKSTLVNGDLTVTGSLNVQGDLTYVGVNNLRVKDHQIELNSNDGGSASLAGADQAGIVIRGARTTENVKDDASILYNHADDSLVINKTIKGRVSNATTAASADKVAQKLTVNVTDETGSLKKVEFDGSEAKTVDVNLQGLQNQINNLTGDAGSIATQINNAINALNSDVTATATGDAAKDGVFVLQGVKIVEGAGKLTSATPTAIEVEKAGAAAAVKTALIGKNTDDENSDTIKGAKKYADSLADNYAKAVHQHEISNVNGLSDALAGKAAKTHTHAIADVTDLQTALDKKQNALTTNQLNAVNSGVTAERLSGYDTHVANDDIHVTLTDKATWNGIEQKAKTYTDTEIGKLGLGSAAKKNVLTKAIADSLPEEDLVNLVTAAQVKKYTDDASADAVAKVVAGAPSDFDTLKEVADWIKSDTTGAAALQTDVAGLKTKVSTLESVSHTHDNKAELDKIEDGDVAKWNGKQDKLSDTQLAAVDSGITATKVGNYDSHVDNADIHVTAEQKNTWNRKQDALANADVLKDITSTKVTNWDDAFAKAHVHDNKTVLDGITEAKVTAWDGAKAAVIGNDGDDKSVDTIKGAKKYADAVKSEVIGNKDKDTENSATIEGAKKYADGKVAELNNTVNNLSAEALKNVKAGSYVSVSTKSNNSQTISVTTKDVATASDSDSANGLALAADVKKYVDGKNTEIKNNYVKKAGDTMTGNLTMPSNGTNGIIFGNMKIVWNSADGGAIEFVPTTA